MAQVKKYAGGLRLIVENMPSLRSVSIGILVGAGSCLENADNNGISHFIEHTTFKGTKRFNSRTLSEAFDDIGSQVNAFTSKEMTCYYVKSTKSAMERSVDLLSDMFLNSVYDEDELNREKGVIIEEINMSEDTPEDVCLDTLSLAYFGNDGLGRTILGSKENITKFDKSYIEAYRKAYYNADNVVVSFAGNVTIEEADLLVSKYIEPFLSTNKSDSLIVPTEKNLYGKISKNKEIEQLHLALGFSCVKYDDELNNIVPETSAQGYDVKAVINRIVDGGDFFEIQSAFARNIVVGFARIDGVVVGIIANQPNFKAGCLDIDASDKAARFIRICNSFNVPIVNLVDVPGFMPGLAQERGGIIRHGAKMLFAYASATVPKITLIMRKAYGGAYLAMCCKEMGADMVYAWPTAEIAVMGAKGAVNVLYGKELKAIEDPAKREELAAKYRAEYSEKFESPYQAASKGMITGVIEPAETKGVLAMALRATIGKRETRLPKKHGNIPL